MVANLCYPSRKGKSDPNDSSEVIRAATDNTGLEIIGCKAWWGERATFLSVPEGEATFPVPEGLLPEAAATKASQNIQPKNIVLKPYNL